jgi:hypothetical protein
MLAGMEFQVVIPEKVLKDYEAAMAAIGQPQPQIQRDANTLVFEQSGF